jgi:Glycosyl hydrolases family 15
MFLQHCMQFVPPGKAVAGIAMRVCPVRTKPCAKDGMFFALMSSRSLASFWYARTARERRVTGCSDRQRTESRDRRLIPCFHATLKPAGISLSSLPFTLHGAAVSTIPRRRSLPKIQLLGRRACSAVAICPINQSGITESSATCGRLRSSEGMAQLTGSVFRGSIPQVPEELLDHWEGYKGSGPVRVGNAAHTQLQLDIYGEVMDAARLYNKHRNPISCDLWQDLRRLADWVSNNWNRQDCGIREVRGLRRYFVYSKMMCWVALDRALRLALKRSLPGDYSRWRRVRDQIYDEVLESGWSEQRQAFVQTLGSSNLDASNLAMPLVFFMAPNDPKMIKTIEAIIQPTAKGGLCEEGMVRRYNVAQTRDGLKGDEGSFNMCTFWLVEALTRTGRSQPELLKRAHILFQKMLMRANHLGLFSEEAGVTGEPLGNMPQALAHPAFISAAVNLDRALDERAVSKSWGSSD